MPIREPDRPGAVLQQAGDRAQGGRLAGAVGAEQRDHLSATHSEREIAHDRRAVVRDAQIVKLKYRVGGRHRCLNPPLPAVRTTYLSISAQSLVQHKRHS
jgi:hypothetical protein